MVLGKAISELPRTEQRKKKAPRPGYNGKAGKVLIEFIETRDVIRECDGPLSQQAGLNYAAKAMSLPIRAVVRNYKLYLCRTDKDEDSYEGIQ